MTFVFKVISQQLATEKLRLFNKPSAWLIQKIFNQQHYALFQVISKTRYGSLSSELLKLSKQSNPDIVTVGLTNDGWQMITLNNLESVCAITDLTNTNPNALFAMLNAQGFLLENLLLPNIGDVDNDLSCVSFYSLPPSIIPTQAIDGQRLVFGKTGHEAIETMLRNLATSLVQKHGGDCPNLWLFRESVNNYGIIALCYLKQGKFTHVLIRPTYFVDTNRLYTTQGLLEFAQGKSNV
jgi:hypothetical protein